MSNTGYSKVLNEQVQKLKNTITKDMNLKISQQLQELAKKDAAKDLEKIKNAVERRIFNRLSSIDQQLNDKNTTPDKRKSLFRELSVLIQPKTFLTELNNVLTVANTWKTYNDFYENTSKNSMFSSILKRYRADSKVFTYYQQGLLENTGDLLKALETHGQQLQSYNQVMQEIAAERGDKQLLNFGVGLVGTFIAGPLGGIVGRKISQAMTSDEDRINYSGGLVDKTWDQVYATFQKLLTKLGSEYFNIYFSLYGGFAQRINKDLNKFGYEAQAFDAEAMSFSFGVKASEVKKVDVWLQKNVGTLEEAFRRNQHAFSRDLLQKMESYVKSNVPFGDVSIEGVKVKDTVADLKFRYMLAFIETEFWQQQNDAEALKQYILLLEKLPVQIETASAFADIQLPSMQVIVSRMIHLSVTKFRIKKKPVFTAFHHYHSLQKGAKPSSVQMMKVFELFNGFTTNKTRISLKLSDVNYKALGSIYMGVLKEREFSKDAFSKHLKKKIHRTETKLKPLFSFYDSYREAFLRYKFIQPRYIVSLLVAVSLMLNWASFASAGKFLPGADGLYFNFIENKTLNTQLDDYALNKAVAADNKPRIVQLLSLGADPNLQLDGGITLLEKAVLEREDIAYIETLLSLGADPNIRSGETPVLFYVIDDKNEELVKLLLTYGAQPFVEGRNGYDALAYIDSLGSSNEYYDIMLLLLDEYKEMDGYAVEGTMLKKALAENDFAALKKMFELGADANALIDEKPILFHAVDSGASKEIFNLLFDEGAKVNAVNKDGKTLLVYLTTHLKKSLSLYEYFIAAGVNVNRPDNSGNTPLIAAVNEKEDELVDLLLKAKANPNLENSKGYTALAYALKNEEQDAIEKLLPLTNINKDDYLKWLKDAVKDEKPSLVSLFLGMEMASAISEQDGQKLMFESVKNEDETTLRALLKHGIDPNFTEKYKLSPLEYAQDKKFEGITSILLANGAIKNLGYLANFEGYWRTSYDNIAKFYMTDNQYILEEYVEGESEKYIINEELEITKGDEVYTVASSSYMSEEDNYEYMTLKSESHSSISFTRLEEEDFNEALEEQLALKKEQEAELLKEKQEKEAIMKQLTPLIGEWKPVEASEDDLNANIKVEWEVDEEGDYFLKLNFTDFPYTHENQIRIEDVQIDQDEFWFGGTVREARIIDKNTMGFNHVYSDEQVFERVR